MFGFFLCKKQVNPKIITSIQLPSEFGNKPVGYIRIGHI